MDTQRNMKKDTEEFIKKLVSEVKNHLFVHTGKWFDQKVLNWLNTDST